MTLTIACMLSLLLAINLVGVTLGDKLLPDIFIAMFIGCTFIAWIAACIVQDLKGK